MKMHSEGGVVAQHAGVVEASLLEKKQHFKQCSIVKLLFFFADHVSIHHVKV